MMAEPSTDSIPHPFAAKQQADPEPALAYLSELADRLGLIDPVTAYYRPLEASWEQLTAEAARLRQVAGVAAEVSSRLDERLGRLDGSWEGRDADAFVAYIRVIGAAGGDVHEALNTLAGALDEMVTTVRHIADDLADVLADTADLTSESMTLPSGGTKRARAQLQEAQDSAKQMYEVARDVMEAFQRLCDGVDGPDVASRSIEIKHKYPQERFKLHDAASEPGGSADVTTPSSASEGKHTGSGDPSAPQDPPPPAPAPQESHAASSGTPMVPMGMLGGFAMGGGGARRQPKTRPVTKPSELLGEPGMVAPPVIGEEEPPPPAKPAAPGQPPATPPAT